MNPFSLINRTISRQLFLWFVVMTFVPLISVVVLMYTISVTMLSTEVERSLLAVADIQVDRLETFAQRQLADVADLVYTLNVTQADALLTALETGDISTDLSPVMVGLTREYDYDDLYLISAEGEIVWAMSGQADVGTNLIDGLYEESNLARLFSQVRAARTTALSQIRFYSPAGRPVLFAAAPIMQGQQIQGVLAVALDLADIYAITSNYTGLGQQGETLLATRIDNEAVFITPSVTTLLRRSTVVSSSVAKPPCPSKPRCRGLTVKGRALIIGMSRLLPCGGMCRRWSGAWWRRWIRLRRSRSFGNSNGWSSRQWC